MKILYTFYILGFKPFFIHSLFKKRYSFIHPFYLIAKPFALQSFKLTKMLSEQRSPSPTPLQGSFSKPHLIPICLFYCIHFQPALRHFYQWSLANLWF